MSETLPPYLRPYHDATRVHGNRFHALLWASPDSQAMRFAALARAYPFAGKSVIDAGCGRADLLDYFIRREIELDHYVGLEAVDTLADAAEAKQHRACTIVRADFVKEPVRLFVGADAVVYCGSLNTMSEKQFYSTLQRGFDAAADALVFNFLSSPRLAAAKYLTWHRPEDVKEFLGGLGRRVEVVDDYLEGDCTMAAWKDE